MLLGYLMSIVLCEEKETEGRNQQKNASERQFAYYSALYCASSRPGDLMTLRADPVESRIRKEKKQARGCAFLDEHELMEKKRRESTYPFRGKYRAACGLKTEYHKAESQMPPPTVSYDR